MDRYGLDLERMRRAMTSQGINLTQLSEMTGISYSWVRRFLNGESVDPRLNTMMAMATSLGLELSDLIVRL